jgi:hypothetical protein
VTAVAAVMSIFKKKRCKLQSASLRNVRPSCQKAERANFLEENTRGSRSLSQKSRKGRIPKKLAPKLKKLELNCTNLMLNSKNARSDCAKMPDPSISSGTSPYCLGTFDGIVKKNMPGKLFFFQSLASSSVL